MKSKLFKIIIAVFLITGLSGCEKSEEDLLHKVWDYLTPMERSMIKLYDMDYNYNSYNPAYSMLLVLRSDLNPSDKAVPFCEVVNILEDLESKPDWKSPLEKRSLLTQWEVYKGESLRESCNKMNGVVTQNPVTEVVKEEVTKDAVVDQVVADTVTLKGDTLISPAKVRELTLSAKECNRAKVSLLSITEDGRYLTIDDYQEVTKLILDCENLKLQIELNN